MESKEKDPLDELFVEKPELNLVTAKLRLKTKEIEIRELKDELNKLQIKFDKRERLLESTENHRLELLKDYNIMRKNIRNYERIDKLEIDVDKIMSLISSNSNDASVEEKAPK